MNIKEKLMNIQAELKAPKSQDNNFGKYKYRSAEDILEAVKPLLKKYESVLAMSDSIVQVGERYYLEATAILSCIKEPTEIVVKAMAREEEEKKGMDQAQVTGSASSYARKYALNGLFAIDDTKDSDFTNDKKDEKPTAPTNPQPKLQADKPQPTPSKISTEVKPTPFVKPIEKPVEQPKHTCDDCKKEIIPVKTAKGVDYTVEQIIEGTKEKYNANLCWDCAAKHAQQAKK